MNTAAPPNPAVNTALSLTIQSRRGFDLRVISANIAFTHSDGADRYVIMTMTSQGVTVACESILIPTGTAITLAAHAFATSAQNIVALVATLKVTVPLNGSRFSSDVTVAWSTTAAAYAFTAATIGWVYLPTARVEQAGTQTVGPSGGRGGNFGRDNQAAGTTSE